MAPSDAEARSSPRRCCARRRAPGRPPRLNDVFDIKIGSTKILLLDCAYSKRRNIFRRARLQGGPPSRLLPLLLMNNNEQQ